MSPVLAYGLALFLFTANDLLFWLVAGSYAIYLADYAVKLAMLAVLLAAGAHRLNDPRPGESPRRSALALWFVFAVIANLALEHAATRIGQVLPTPRLHFWPDITTPWLRILDLTAGLALTAVVEEATARRLAWHVLAPRLSHRWGPLAISSLLFGLAHWGSGPWLTLSAGLGGAALFLAYQRTGSLGLVIAAHYLVNLIIFA